MNVPATFHYTGFYDLLCDAVFQHRLAKESSDSYQMNRHARASISASALVLECAANCLLADADISTAFALDLDKLPLIAKFETCVHMAGSGEFDRGRVEVQKVSELVKIRNGFVHPRAQNIGAEVGQPTEQGVMVAVPVSFDGKRWPALQIPKAPIFWSADSALTVINAVVNFLSYVLVDIRCLSPEGVSSLLVSRVELGEIVIPTQFDEFISELKDIAQHGVDLTFLGCD